MLAIPHCHFVTGPVFGAPAQAENASLLVILSGDYRSKKEVAYILVPAIGRRVLDLGGNVEKGDIASLLGSRPFVDNRSPAPTFKIIGNSLILGSMELIAEAYTISEKTGVGQELVYEFIKGEISPSPNP
jgi:3-hydroxyisobutyrate dehydrogenase-like beta-hydroxyacid dehydrogenase